MKKVKYALTQCPMGHKHRVSAINGSDGKQYFPSAREFCKTCERPVANVTYVKS